MDRFFQIVQKGIGFASLALSLFILGVTVSLCRFGFEFTDESFYLLWITEPDCFPVSATLFGPFYHVFYRLFDESIAALRMFNVLTIFGVAWLFCDATLRCFFAESFRRVERLAFSGALAVSSLALFTKWLPTPSYNSLSLLGVLAAATGGVTVVGSPGKKGSIGWVLIGLGGWLAFLGKPTTALALGVFVFVSLLISGKLRVGGLLLAVCSAMILLGVSAVLIDGSLAAFYARLSGAAERAAASPSGYSWADVFRVEPIIDFKFAGFRIFAVLTALFSALFATVLSDRKAIARVGIILTVGLCFGVVLAMCGWVFVLLPSRDFKWYLFLSIPLSAALGALLHWRRCGTWVGRSRGGVLFLCAVLPYAVALGTNTNMWQFSAFCSISWILAGVLFLSIFSAQKAVGSAVGALALSAQLVLVLLLWPEFEAPWRQTQPLAACTQPVRLGRDSSLLTVSDDAAQVIRAMQQVAGEAGFERGMPVLKMDRSAFGDGLVFAMGAFPVGGPLFGGARNNVDFASTRIQRVSPEVLAEAWLLLDAAEVDGEYVLAVLQLFGKNLETDFEPVGSISAREGRERYMLFKPIGLGGVSD